MSTILEEARSIKLRKFQSYRAYRSDNIGEDDKNLVFVLDFAGDGYWIFDSKYEYTFITDEDGRYDHNGVQNFILFEELDKPVFEEYDIEAVGSNLLDLIEPFSIAKTENGEFALIYQIERDSDYPIRGIILSEGETYISTWDSNGFTLSGIPSKTDIDKVLLNKTNIIYN